MKHILSYLVSVLLFLLLLFQQAAQAQTTFMDLWCEYGGKGCEKTPSSPKKAPIPETPAPVAAKQPATTPLIKPDANMIKHKGISYGRYYALVIGNNAYTHLDKLKTAITDAREIARILKTQYGFSVTQLTNATRDQIIFALDEYRKILKAEDNLLIYYAGHGWQDRESERGYWLPVDANRDTRARWVSNADVTDTLKALKARHVLIVADSCYAGTLTRSPDMQINTTRGLKLTEQPNNYLETLMGRKSRTVLASGALEPVSDQGGGKHSVFAYAFLKSLNENQAIIDGTQLFIKVRQQVLLNARQTPQYSDIRFAGHDVGGDFVFLRRK